MQIAAFDDPISQVFDAFGAQFDCGAFVYSLTTSEPSSLTLDSSSRTLTLNSPPSEEIGQYTVTV